jgi:hypothetical protein
MTHGGLHVPETVARDGQTPSNVPAVDTLTGGVSSHLLEEPASFLVLAALEGLLGFSELLKQ